VTRRIAWAVIAVTALTVASPANAHPRGQRPLILIARNATGLDVSWIVAGDDMIALGTALELGPIEPGAFAAQPAYQRYVTGLLRFTPAGRDRCDSEMLAVEEVATGYATTLRVDCGARVDRMTMFVGLLLDLSPEYIHLFKAATSAGSRDGATSAGEPTAVIDFTDPAPAPEEDIGPRSKLELFASGTGGISLLVALGLAFLLGAVHGITPGHGKTLTAAYVVGTHGTLRHAGLLAGVVALAHGASTFVLALIASGLDQLAPQRITPWLEGVSALLAAIVGILLLRGRHSHSHGSPEAPARPGIGQLVAIGLIGGLIPGPEAFAVSFIAVAVGKLGLAAILIAAFSLGLALVVFGVAALAVFAGNRMPRTDRVEHLARRIGGVVFLLIAAALAVRAIDAG
jgi:ABC-type nickel/cobalt efflux system permease component RcnA